MSAGNSTPRPRGRRGAGLDPVVAAAAGYAIRKISRPTGRPMQAKRERKPRQADRRAEWEARRSQREEERIAAAAARHALALDVQCPICGAVVAASMASDGETQATCPDCSNRVSVHNSGNVTLLGPKDEALSKAEDLSIEEDRLCSRCGYFRPKWKRELKYYAGWIVALASLLPLRLESADESSTTGRSSAPSCACYLALSRSSRRSRCYHWTTTIAPIATLDLLRVMKIHIRIILTFAPIYGWTHVATPSPKIEAPICSRELEG